MPQEFGSAKLVRLKVSDIDSERMMVKVEQGKGEKRPLHDFVRAAALGAAQVLERASLADVSFSQCQGQSDFH